MVELPSDQANIGRDGFIRVHRHPAGLFQHGAILQDGRGWLSGVRETVISSGTNGGELESAILSTCGYAHERGAAELRILRNQEDAGGAVTWVA